MPPARPGNDPFAKLSLVATKSQKDLAASAAVRKEAERMNAVVRQRLELETRRQAVVSGAYSRELRAAQLLYKEQQRIYELERRSQYQARFGRTGGYLAYQADALSRSRGFQAAVGLGMTATAMARRGFSGTVEGNRLDLELRLISMELAGAFKPAIEAATKGLGMFRRFLERLGPNGQSALMVGGVAASAYGLYRGAGLLGGLIGGGGAGAAAGGAGVSGLGLGAGLGVAAFAKSVGRFALKAGGIGLALGAVEELTDSNGFYEMERRRGTSRLGSFFAAVGHVGLNTLTFGGHADRLRAKGELPSGEGPNPGRRQVTLADAGFESPGSAFERMTSALAVVEANNEGKAAVVLLGMIKDMVGEALKAGVGKPPELPGRP